MQAGDRSKSVLCRNDVYICNIYGCHGQCPSCSYLCHGYCFQVFNFLYPLLKSVKVLYQIVQLRVILNPDSDTVDNTVRMERVNLKQKHGLAKVIGTCITLCGAMVMTLYKGPIVNMFGSHQVNLHSSSSASAGAQQHWVAGTVMLLFSVIGWSAFFIVQVSVS